VLLRQSGALFKVIVRTGSFILCPHFILLMHLKAYAETLEESIKPQGCGGSIPLAGKRRLDWMAAPLM
jgi:hypothetical protein